MNYLIILTNKLKLTKKYVDLALSVLSPSKCSSLLLLIVIFLFSLFYNAPSSVLQTALALLRLYRATATAASFVLLSWYCATMHVFDFVR
jgi:hypothetical protein